MAKPEKKLANRGAARRVNKGQPNNGELSRTAPKLPPMQARFVEEYILDLNATQAAIRAGYSARNAGKIGPELLGKTRVKEAIASAIADRAARAEVTAAQILAEVDAIATVDPNSIVQYRRECCRYCYGVGYGYQYRTERERAAALRGHLIELKKARSAKVPRDALPVFDDGGVGFDPRRDPHPECPECLGEGHGRIWIADTRKLTRAQLALYGGVELTKEGLKVIVHPKLKALELAMRHRGMLKEKVEVEFTERLSDRLAAARKRARQAVERAHAVAGGRGDA